ncbi:hypothetical protein EYF80_031362 [Liparis tanakae]|uniref:Uncharacterized protein n=1 Tax=Liparis tanakae TaxID=230148 RepID=A0A4Z2GYP2_9TELE|nr:hypothetical protein EYF80_031362 [Liparis tanakae]
MPSRVLQPLKGDGHRVNAASTLMCQSARLLSGVTSRACVLMNTCLAFTMHAPGAAFSTADSSRRVPAPRRALSLALNTGLIIRCSKEDVLGTAIKSTQRSSITEYPTQHPIQNCSSKSSGWHRMWAACLDSFHFLLSTATPLSLQWSIKVSKSAVLHRASFSLKKKRAGAVMGMSWNSWMLSS